MIFYLLLILMFSLLLTITEGLWAGELDPVVETKSLFDLISIEAGEALGGIIPSRSTKGKSSIKL